MADSRFIKVDGGFERTVAPGDTLTGIAKERGIDLATLLSYNPQYKANPNLIRPGERVLLGSSSGTPGSDLPQTAPTVTTPPMTAPSTPAAPIAPVAPITPPASTDPMDNFNGLLGGLLKNAQGLSTADFLARKRALERATLGKTSEITPEDMRTLTPAQQDAIRSGKASALQPEIDANAYEMEKAQQSIDNFFKVHEEAQKMGQEFADKMVAPDSVLQNAKKVIENDPSQLSTILAGFNDKSKEKLLGILDYTAMKPKSSVTQNQLTDNEVAARSQFVGNQIVKDYNTILGKKLSVDNILNNGATGPGDLSLVFEFMKALDPTSVVRETEYDTAAKSGNIFQGAFAKFNGYLKPTGGFLPENVKQQFKQLVAAKLGAQTTLYNNFASETRSIAQRQGLNPDNVVPDFSGAAGEYKTTADGTKYKKVDGGWQKVSFNDGGTAGTNRPQANKNPGNVKSGGVGDQFAMKGTDGRPITDEQGHLVFASAADGTKALAADLKAKITGNSAHVASTNPTIAELGKAYAEDPHWPVAVAKILGVPVTTRTSAVDFNKLLNAVMTQEGFYA